MKRIFLLVLTLLSFCAVLSSCSVSKYSVPVELSSPSKSGISLAGKTISVSYVNSGVSDDSLFLAKVAEAFIEVLEDEYFDGEEAVGLYKVDNVPDVDNTSKEGMIDLVMTTGTDLAFLFDVAPSGGSSVPSELTLYAYDSMNKADTVQTFMGRVSLGKWDADLYGHVVGQKSADIFAPSWTRENISFYYFSSDKWNEAVALASEYNFPEAITIWMELAQSKDVFKCACAEYNIAAACFILGQHSLSLKWLDKADSHYDIPEAATLRKKIAARM